MNSIVSTNKLESEFEQQQHQYRDRIPSLSNASITKQPSEENQSYYRNRVLKAPIFSKFNNNSSQQYNQQQTPIYRKPFYDFNSMRRNYYSATESCGEETDVDDGRSFASNNPQKQQSYASIKLRAPLKDVNYYSDTETLQTNSSLRNYYKSQPQQQQQEQQFNNYSSNKKSIAQQSKATPVPTTAVGPKPFQSYNQYQQTTAKPFIAPTPTNAAVSVYNNKQSFSLLNRQAKPFVNQSTDNPYSPSAASSANNNGSFFKVPNIYEKLELNQQQSNKYSFISNNNDVHNYQQQQLPSDAQFNNENKNQINSNDNYNTRISEQGIFYLF